MIWPLRRSIRGMKVSDIPITYRLAHNKIAEDIGTVVEGFKKTAVYGWHINENDFQYALACIRYKEGRGPVILVNTRLMGFSRLCDYDRFVYINEPGSEWNMMDTRKAVDRKDFFKQVVAHEYAHLLRSFSGSGNAANAIEEAFAYWFSEQLSGCTSLFESYGEDTYPNFSLMAEAYDALHASTKERGFKETLAGLDKII